MSATRITALAFLAFSTTFAATSWTLPKGVGAVPGPAFFPLAIATVMAALSVALVFDRGSRPAGEPSTTPGTTRGFIGVIGLLFLYLLSWGTGLFALRTALFLCLMLRWTGQGWRSSAGVAAALTGVVVLAFQVGLRVSLE